MRENAKLVEEYRAAWEQYERSWRELQAAAETGDRSGLDRLVSSIESGRLQYSAARDRLAARMLGTGISVPPPVAPDHRVRHTAQLLWELSGKPQGTAENDWLRAERIVRCAGAATS